MDVGEDAALGNGDMAQKLVQLLVIADGELEMTRDDTRLLVVAGGIASQILWRQLQMLFTLLHLTLLIIQ